MDNASGLINLARNIGASTGISFVTTMLDRRQQFHQNVMVHNMQRGNSRFRAAVEHLTHVFAGRGSDPAHAASQAHAMVYQGLQRQASMLSFVDNFRIMSIICLCVIPLMFIMKARKSKGGDAPPMH